MALRQLHPRVFNGIEGLDSMRSVMKRQGKIKEASATDLRRFAHDTAMPKWDEMLGLTDEGKFFTVRGLEQTLLLFCIQYGGCRAHHHVPHNLFNLMGSAK